MLDPDLICYLVSAIAVCLGLLSMVVGPASIKLVRRINKLARDDDDDGEIRPAYDPLTIRGRTCSRMSSAGGTVGLKIPADCPKDKFGHDFIVDLECPDGTTVRVLIPVDSNSREGRASRAHGPCDRAAGLNLVCSGHYA